MSVTVALCWGVVRYGIQMPAQVTISFCNNAGTCMTGSAQLIRETNGLKVSGTVDITTAPFQVDVIRVLYGGNRIFEATGIDKLIDYTGSLSVVINEQWVISLPLSMTLDGPTSLSWRVTTGTMAFMAIVRGVNVSSVVVEYYDIDGRLIYTDNSASVELIASDIVTSGVSEKLTTSATSATSVKACKIVAKAMGTTIFEASAVDQTFCFDISPSVGLTINAYNVLQG